MPLGKSFPGVVCRSLDERKQSINLYGTSTAFKAESVAHEIGHNLGMSHDFNWRHGGTGCAFSSTNPCNGQGFMSYGNHLSQWSECSVKDLAAHYVQFKDNWCMPGNFSIFSRFFMTVCDKKKSSNLSYEQKDWKIGVWSLTDGMKGANNIY